MVEVVLALAGVAVLAAIVFLAMGMGGELGGTHPDHPPLALPGGRPLAGAEVAMLRLPVGVVGYHTQVTNEALRRVAAELTDRDSHIALLEQRLANAQELLSALEASTRDVRVPAPAEPVTPATPVTPAVPAARTAPDPAGRDAGVVDAWGLPDLPDPADGPDADWATDEDTRDRATDEAAQHLWAGEDADDGDAEARDAGEPAGPAEATARPEIPAPRRDTSDASDTAAARAEPPEAAEPDAAEPAQARHMPETDAGRPEDDTGAARPADEPRGDRLALRGERYGPAADGFEHSEEETW